MAGNRTRLENAAGEVTNYEWDVGNRLVRTTSIDGVTTHKYHPENGRLVETTTPDTSETFEYDAQAKLIKHTRLLGGKAYSTTVGYNARGQVERKQLPDGQTLRYHYHQDGVNAGTLRAITREQLLGLSQETLVGEIDLEARDGQTGYLSHNGVRTQREFHADGSTKSLEVSDTLSLQYTFDDQGNISGIDEDGLKQSFFYEHGRLALADMVSGEYAYGYDDVGNRVASYEVKKGAEPTENEYTYSEDGNGNRLLSAKDAVSGFVQEYEYNEVGAALKAGDEYSYTYNVKQRPIEVYKAGELVAEYRYNTFGERVQKTVYKQGVAESTYYLYDGHTLAAEIDNNGQVTSQYLYLQDRYPVVKFEGKEVFAIHTDQLGTPRKLTDDNAELVWDASYTPFGQADVTLAKVEMNLRFPGQYEDSETGTHYNYFRDYDPGTGRYITSDPIGLQAGVNTYAYSSSNPILGSDILGLEDDVNDGNVLDKVKEFVLEAGAEGVDQAIKLALGENFVDAAAQTLSQIPGEFDKLATNEADRYGNLPLEVIKPLFTVDAAKDMAFTFAVLLAIKKGANLAGKTSILSFVAKELLEKLVNFGIKAFIVSQFGEAAGEFFDNLDQLGEKIESVANNPNFSCADTEVVAAEIARMLADVALDGKLVDMFTKLKLKKPKTSKKCSEPDTKEEHKECYKNIPGFAGMGLSREEVNRLENLLGAESEFCETK